MSELPVYKVTCPHCNQEVEVPLDFVELGLVLYPQERIYQEMTFLSYYLHWSRDEVMRLNHLERRRWCREYFGCEQKLSNTEQNTLEFR